MPSYSALALLTLASATLVGASNRPITTYSIPLSGSAESNFAHPAGGTGDADGAGLVTLAIDPANKQVCYQFALSGL